MAPNPTATPHAVLAPDQLPIPSKRLDCMITGQDDAQHDDAVILELKQWETCGDGNGG